jgi:hypothetical protein
MKNKRILAVAMPKRAPQKVQTPNAYFSTYFLRISMKMVVFTLIITILRINYYYCYKLFKKLHEYIV